MVDTKDEKQNRDVEVLKALMAKDGRRGVQSEKVVASQVRIVMDIIRRNMMLQI